MADSFIPLYCFHRPSVRAWGGQDSGVSEKKHKNFNVLFLITREKIEVPVKIGDKKFDMSMCLEPFENFWNVPEPSKNCLNLLEQGEVI